MERKKKSIDKMKLPDIVEEKGKAIFTLRKG